MSAGAVHLDGLKLGFNGALAADITLDVNPGEVVVFLGPSGCGKSTILRALAGLLAPMGGHATVDGAAAGSTAQCAMVFQEDALFPWRTALKNVMYPIRLRGVGKKEAKAAAQERLEQVGLGSYGGHLPGHLSGGMRQRVQLARTLACEPKVMLMDEPFGALDAQTRLEMQQLLLAVWAQQKMTILFVTHDVDEALLLADRVVLLSHRPATVADIITIDEPRSPEAQFTDAYRRSRYEILQFLGHAPAVNCAAGGAQR
ncbi:ABC transporter ATP-binding protein [Mycobacterium sherrisii]|uniref:ABC transporter ATP-binding protein n=1 Tax=Mycobacterium sherrisii TaxID=243061 RepID=A0A1E3T2S2_9MYCO|nr:ABC transporter ATP-binding protein [Mycobacterium sherrisii]MCV7029919.1 ABC transporter ATP-binding protein [Mycobacterium sherrisii]MEC4762541.1 ABC transporter ATP-binding protein [Mycobacterium sherrisii]ODR08670.1 ABC transporter ATP-binding protein [Mycobacterium sherrisii]ORW85012.1 ABC transporter ATP-binding protein [Mycobacterium sherrisii]